MGKDGGRGGRGRTRGRGRGRERGGRAQRRSRRRRPASRARREALRPRDPLDAPAPLRHPPPMSATFVLSEARALLARTPRLLDAWLRDLPPAWLACDEGPDTWSPEAIVGHLIVGERTDWMTRVRHLLEHGDAAPFAPFDRLAQFRLPPAPLAERLDAFAALRAENLAALDALGLGEADLDRRGRHPDFGPVTLRQLLATWVAHDLTHVTQIARVMAGRCAGDVGPWRAYLRVVRDAEATRR